MHRSFMDEWIFNIYVLHVSFLPSEINLKIQ